MVFNCNFVFLDKGEGFFANVHYLNVKKIAFFIYPSTHPFPPEHVWIYKIEIFLRTENLTLEGWSINFHVSYTDLLQTSSFVICIPGVNYSASNAVESA